MLSYPRGRGMAPVASHASVMPRAPTWLLTTHMAASCEVIGSCPENSLSCASSIFRSMVCCDVISELTSCWSSSSSSEDAPSSRGPADVSGSAVESGF